MKGEAGLAGTLWERGARGGSEQLGKIRALQQEVFLCVVNRFSILGMNCQGGYYAPWCLLKLQVTQMSGACEEDRSLTKVLSSQVRG